MIRSMAKVIGKAAVEPPVLSHGRRILPAVTVDAYNHKLWDGFAATVPVAALFALSSTIGADLGNARFTNRYLDEKFTKK
jgi:hypothetical protein